MPTIAGEIFECGAGDVLRCVERLRGRDLRRTARARTDHGGNKTQA